MEGSRELFRRAQDILPGGVNSPVRAFAPHPFFVRGAKGCTLTDIDGDEYLDFCLGYGPLLLGHAHPEVVRAIREQAGRGTLYGAPGELEVEYASFIRAHVPNCEMVRCVNSGTEATMTAIRLARGVTGCDAVVKVDGGFHGSHDSLLVKGGSGMLTRGTPSSAGVPRALARLTRVVPFNDEDAMRDVLDDGRVACVILEPVMGNIGCVPPEKGYLKRTARLVRDAGALLVLDEVITGFRLGMGGAQERLGIDADLVVLGKVAGGGLPIGVVAGRKALMSHLTPEGDVYNAGTFSGNPLAMSAGLATFRTLESSCALARVERASRRLHSAIVDTIEGLGIQACMNSAPGMSTLFLKERVRDARDARSSDIRTFARLHRHLLGEGIFIPPSQFECWFTCAVHEDEHIDRLAEALEGWFRSHRGEMAPPGRDSVATPVHSALF